MSFTVLKDYLVIAGLFYAFWEFLHHNARPEIVEKAGKWLLSVTHLNENADWQAAVITTFDRLFYERIDSWRFFCRSLVYSLFGSAISILIWIWIASNWVGYFIGINYLFLIIATPVVAVFVCIPDYFALIETRLVLGAMQTGQGKVKSFFLLFYDLFLTIAIVTLVTIVSIYYSGGTMFSRMIELKIEGTTSMKEGLTEVSKGFDLIKCDVKELITGGESAIPAYCSALKNEQNTNRPEVDPSSGPREGERSMEEIANDPILLGSALLLLGTFILIPIGIFSTFLTSIWLWIYISAALVSRPLSRVIRRTGIFSGILFHMEKQAFRIVGAYNFILVLLLLVFIQ